LLSFDEAKSRLLENVNCIAEVESVAVFKAVGLVLAEDVSAPIDIPPFENSAMDGIAFNYAELKKALSQKQDLSIQQTVYAGHKPAVMPSMEQLKNAQGAGGIESDGLGLVARIFTGAAMPQGTDTVVLQEDCVFEGDRVSIAESELQLMREGQHVRKQGEDIQKGSVVLHKGRRLKAQDIGLLFSLGLQGVQVFKPLRVAVISTGDELREPGQSLALGQIYNSNAPMLLSALQEAGFQAERFHVEDDLQKTVEQFEYCAKHFDALMSIGGVSVGDADYVKAAIDQLGQVDFWKVAMKPGKPLAIGQVSGVPLLGLPGNPVSSFASWQLFALPFLRSLQGQADKPECRPEMTFPILLERAQQPKRETFMRVQRVFINGQWCLQPYTHQGSGVLSSVVYSEGFARIRNDRETKPFDLVAFISFDN